MFNQAALEFIDQMAANLQRGYLIAIDYGFLGDGFERTVEVRDQHRHLDSPFERIGDADITMRVDWRSIIERTQANGLRVAGFTDQHHFLTGIISQFAIGDWVDPSLSSDSRKAKRELQTLLHPEMLGRAFQVLGLTKNIDPGAQPLSGFKFAHAPRSGAES
jgi:SAM-dependent MidA family methyltransferase